MGDKIITKASVLFLKEETTEGTPVIPGAATDAVDLREGFDMSPQIESIQSDLIRASIGAAKGFTGVENPTFNLALYLRNSGTQGTAPNYRLFLKACFGGEEVETVEYTLAAGSTTTVLNITSILANGIQGQAHLIKDPVNGYRIRFAHSLATNASTMSFAVPTAPGTGVAIGKPVTYYGKNTGHPTFASWLYMGNGGTTFMMSGCRTTGLTITAEAGQLIGIDVENQGRAFYQNPIEITSSFRYVDFTDDDGTFAAAVAIGWYKSPHELAAAIQVAMRAANTGETATVTYSDTTGKFTIKTTGTVLSLLWNTGTNAANTIGTKIGFSVAANDTGTAATTGYTSDDAQTYAAPYTATYDSADALICKNMEAMFGDQEDYLCFDPDSVTIRVTNTRVVQKSICAESGQGNSAFSARVMEVEFRALLEKYDADRFERYRLNTESRFQFSFGEKSGGNWVAGKAGGFYLRTCTVNEYDVVDVDGYVGMTVKLLGFVPSDGSSEGYLSFV